MTNDFKRIVLDICIMLDMNKYDSFDVERSMHLAFSFSLILEEMNVVKITDKFNVEILDLIKYEKALRFFDLFD
ncbi:MAG: hypothetical protein CME69_12345 [Halobacteriovorax sp.]|nr:hypothetical protein [Halobacteriovorax sp.]|tara:strand:- start:5747 stop:5968 length:222 start_codon:yes stop_codon:yes gene_type:complete